MSASSNQKMQLRYMYVNKKTKHIKITNNRCARIYTKNFNNY